MKKALMAVTAAAFVMSCSAAFAAPCTPSNTCNVSGLDGTTTLSFGNPISIEDQNLPLGAYTASGSFSVAGNFDKVRGAADVAFDAIPPGATSVPSGIMNLMIDFTQDGIALGSFAITDAAGVINAGADSFMFSLLSASDVLFNITGTAFRTSGASLPDYNINLTAVPVPGAIPLLLSGLVGLGFASRRKRTSSV